MPLTNQVNDVKVDVDIDSVIMVDDKTYTVGIRVYFNVEWNEPRLVLKESFKVSSTYKFIFFFSQKLPSYVRRRTLQSMQIF